MHKSTIPLKPPERSLPPEENEFCYHFHLGEKRFKIARDKFYEYSKKNHLTYSQLNPSQKTDLKNYFNQAIECYNTALEFIPKIHNQDIKNEFAYTFAKKGACYQNLDEPEKALECFKKACEIAVFHPKYYLYLYYYAEATYFLADQSDYGYQKIQLLSEAYNLVNKIIFLLKKQLLEFEPVYILKKEIKLKYNTWMPPTVKFRPFKEIADNYEFVLFKNKSKQDKFIEQKKCQILMQKKVCG